MTLVIHQAYFLPWLGYLSKLAYADTFVVLDDVFFRDRHYHKRTRIINMHGLEMFIGLPVGHNFEIPCNRIYLKENRIKTCNRILRTLEMSYKRADFFNCEWGAIELLLKDTLCTYDNLVDIDIELIKGLLDILNIPCPKIVYSSSIGRFVDRTDRYIEICKCLNANAIIFGSGKSLMLHDLNQLQSAGIKLLYQDYYHLHPTYTQYGNLSSHFTKGLSVIDTLFNVGSIKTKKLVTGNAYIPQPLN